MLFFTKIEIALLSGLGICFIWQFIYYFCYLGKPSRYGNSIKKGKITLPAETPPVSVIICARNESENLAKFLPSVLEQDYPQYEVIVVNEGSSDESDEVLGSLGTKYKHLYHTYVPSEAKNLSKKKLAVTLGIKAAKYDVLLFTEADCKPLSSSWIKSMTRHFDQETSIVTGYGAFPKSTGLITKLAVFDNLISGLQYLSSTLNRKPYMGVGRNLAYRKELFFSENGFYTHLKLHAGEDDLFVNEKANKNNTKAEISPESVTVMENCYFSIWKELKVKQITTSKYYKKGPGIFHSLTSVSRLGFWGFALTCILLNPLEYIIPSIAGFIILCRWFIQGYTLNKAASILQQEEKFYWSIPVLDIIQPCYNLYFRIYHVFRGKSDYTWKIN